jgi:hypothetical protein
VNSSHESGFFDIANINKRRSIYEIERSIFCQTYIPWFPELDAVHCLYVAFEMLQVFENKPLRLAHWVITLYLGVWISSFEVNPFNVIHHLRRAAKRAHPIWICISQSL